MNRSHGRKATQSYRNGVSFLFQDYLLLLRIQLRSFVHLSERLVLLHLLIEDRESSRTQTSSSGASRVVTPLSATQPSSTSDSSGTRTCLSRSFRKEIRAFLYAGYSVCMPCRCYRPLCRIPSRDCIDACESYVCGLFSGLRQLSVTSMVHGHFAAARFVAAGGNVCATTLLAAGAGWVLQVQFCGSGVQFTFPKKPVKVMFAPLPFTYSHGSLFCWSCSGAPRSVS